MSDGNCDLEADVPPSAGNGDLLQEPTAPVAARTPGAFIAIAVGIVLMLGGAVFAAISLSGGDGGSPESAVQKLLDAVANEDVLGVLDALPRRERDAYRDDLPAELVTQLNRLQILDVDLSKISGIDVEFKDVKLTSTSIRDDIADVRIVGGTSVAKANPAQLPLGDFVRKLVGDELTKAKASSETADLAGEESAPITTVKVDGTWYVSGWYTAAEAARRESGFKVPAKGAGVPAKGTASAEQAVKDMLQAMVGLDVRRMIELLPPDEAAALHDYSALFIDEAEQGLAEAQAAFTASITNIDVTASGSGDRSVVKLNSADFDVAVGPIHVAYKDGCVELEIPKGDEGSLDGGLDLPIESGRYCKDDLAKLQEQLSDGAGIAGLPFASGLGVGGQIGSRPADVGFVVIRRDGKWFVSPTRTVLAGLAGAFKSLDRKDLDKVAEGIQAYVGLMTGARSLETSTGQFGSERPPNIARLTPATSADVPYAP